MFIKKGNINIPVVLRVMGWLLMIEAVFMLPPLIIGIIYEEAEAIRSFLFAIMITLGVGAFMTFGIHPRSTEMHKREGFLLTASVWVFFSFFGMLPFLFTGSLDNVTDAFFEAMSGFTTTGATVILDVEEMSHSILFWRALMQWIGGMGIILFTLAVIPMLNHQGGIQLFNAEVTGITHDKLRPRISQTAKSLWIVYITLSLAMALLLWLGPMNLFDAVCHTLSALSTGGFSTKNTSIAWWDSYYVDIVVTVFMFLGGVNFALLYKAALGKFKSMFQNGTLRWYIGITIVVSALCILGVVNADVYNSWSDIIIYPIFECVSVMTSTGFSVANFELWGQFAIMLIFLLMYFGSCAGSTAGGAKIDRLVFMLKNTKNEFYHVLHPNSITTVRVNSKVIPSDAVSKVIAFLSIYTMIMIFSSVILTAFNVPIFDAMFASLSAIGNMGFGSGITGMEGSYANLPVVGKWLLSFMMLTGRLELFTFLIIFTKGFWIK